MKPISTTESPSLKFSVKNNKLSNKIIVQSNKIGWLHANVSPKAKFDIIIKDALGRVRATKLNCDNPTGKYGELVNIDTMLGEELTIELENVSGQEGDMEIFVN